MNKITNKFTILINSKGGSLIKIGSAPVTMLVVNELLKHPSESICMSPMAAAIGILILSIIVEFHSRKPNTEEK